MWVSPENMSVYRLRRKANRQSVISREIARQARSIEANDNENCTVELLTSINGHLRGAQR
jgi:hypothetical protein